MFFDWIDIFIVNIENEGLYVIGEVDVFSIEIGVGCFVCFVDIVIWFVGI